MADRIIGYDLAVPNMEGTDNVTRYLLDILNSYPGLDGEEIRFQNIEAGLSMVPLGNAAVISERVSITNHVTQRCQYSFQIFRTAKGLSENNQIRYKEFLDNLALWLNQMEYPDMAEGMEMISIKPAAASALYVREGNQTQAWMVPINASYTREFDK